MVIGGAGAGITSDVMSGNPSKKKLTGLPTLAIWDRVGALADASMQISTERKSACFLAMTIVACMEVMREHVDYTCPLLWLSRAKRLKNAL